MFICVETVFALVAAQNPTGSTVPLARKAEIYAICAEYDLVIIEDDAYYTLQFPRAHGGEPLIIAHISCFAASGNSVGVTLCMLWITSARLAKISCLAVAIVTRRFLDFTSQNELRTSVRKLRLPLFQS